MNDQPMTAVIAELRALPTPDLAARYEELWGKPPRVRHREFLWKRIAWKLQEQRTGGLSEVAQRRLEELIAEIDIPITERTRTVAGKLRADRPRDPLAVGSTITREWRGRTIVVRVVEGGFEHNGVLHRSLTAVAKAVTGAHWNGRLFFGLGGKK